VVVVNIHLVRLEPVVRVAVVMGVCRLLEPLAQ